MVMEYVEHELKVLIDKHRFSIAEMKCLQKQLLSGVNYLHEQWVLHRDLKTTNTLLNNRGVLKICDFGLARRFGDPLKPYTQRVQSLWYRAPELLLGQKLYNDSIDMWSVGCISAEVLLRKPIFEGRVEMHQLGLIFELTGVPTEDSWPGCEKLPNWKAVKFNPWQSSKWRTTFPDELGLSDRGLELIQRMLEPCPEYRLSAEDALEHEWFSEAPYPPEPSMMPTFQESNNEGRRAQGPPVRLGPKGAAVGAVAGILGGSSAGKSGLPGLAGAGLMGNRCNSSSFEALQRANSF